MDFLLGAVEGVEWASVAVGGLHNEFSPMRQVAQASVEAQSQSRTSGWPLASNPKGLRSGPELNISCWEFVFNWREKKKIQHLLIRTFEETEPFVYL